MSMAHRLFPLFPLFQLPYYIDGDLKVTETSVKALAHYKDFHKDFSEKFFVKIVIHI